MTATSGSRSVLVAIAGGSCAGKTHLATALVAHIRESGTTAAVVGLDRYYLGLAQMKDDNFDDPDAVDLAQAWRDVESLRSGTVVQLPTYRYDSDVHERRSETERQEPVEVLVVEGLFAHSTLPASLRAVAWRIFVDLAEPERLERRLMRDRALGIAEPESLRMWRTQAEPAFTQHVLPSVDHGTHIVRGDRGTAVADVWRAVSAGRSL